MGNDYITFLGMIFLAIFLLVRSLMVPTFGTEARTAKMLRKRVKGVVAADKSDTRSLLHAKHLREASPMERFFLSWPGAESLDHLIVQAGKEYPAYRLILLSILLALVAGLGVWFFIHDWIYSLIAAVIAILLPILKLRHDRNKRMETFEEQLPEAIDVMARALQAGHPFTDAMNLVAEEMSDPIAKEFRTTHSDMNYGSPPKIAFYTMLERVPSVSLMAMVTAVLIQRETGGNMAEILGKISGVIRSRFRFQRKVLSLSAEARLSAWILAMMPFVLALGLTIASPDYLPMLKDDPDGRQLIIFGFGAVITGIFWMRYLIRIKV